MYVPEKELPLSSWQHADHADVSEPAYFRWSCWFCQLVNWGQRFCNNWKMSGVRWILEDFSCRRGLPWWSRSPSLHVVHQGEMNTKICKKSKSADLARPALLHLEYNTLLLLIRIRTRMWSCGLFLRSKEQGHGCVFKLLIAVHLV